MQVSPNFDPTGVAMISVALLADAVIGNVQEQAMRQHSAANSEVIFYSYSSGAVMLTVGLAAAGMLGPGFAYYRDYRGGIMYLATAAYSLAGYIGMQVRAFPPKIHMLKSV